MFETLLTDLQSGAFWFAIGKIIWVDVLLSGDNALVIAMACGALAPKQRVVGMFLGAAVAVLLRIAFAGIVSELMLLSYLKIAGGVALLFIAIKLMLPDDGGTEIKQSTSLWAAIGTIALADLVMSLDNVIAVAAIANGHLFLLVFGLVVSIPMIVAGASLIMKALESFPWLVYAGAGLLGFVAGEVIMTDPAINLEEYKMLGGVAGAIFVLAFGMAWRFFVMKPKEATDAV